MGTTLNGIKQLLNGRKARIVQLLSRLAAKGFIGLAGMVGMTDPDTHAVGGVADAVAIAVFGIALFLVDLLIHKARHGAVLKDKSGT